MTSPQTFRSESHTYRVISELSQGGQGKTLLVERDGAEPAQTYVLKLLRLEHVDDWKQVELFEREVTTLATLEHPGIPRLVDRIVEHDRTAGIVQTVVPGQTLAEQIDSHQPLSPERFEQIVRQSLEILAYLHEQVPPVMHRDINPRNVMVDEQRTYLIDFGAVRVGGKTDMTSVGTFGYMAPEQIIGRPQPASDMYGLGMTLVCLAERREVGDLPIDATTGQVDRTRLLRGMEARVRDLVLAMIEPGLAERLSEPREALRRLDAPEPVKPEALPAAGAGGNAVPALAAAEARMSPSNAPSRSVLVAVAAVLLVGAAVVGFTLVQSEPSVSVEPPTIPTGVMSEPPVPVVPPPPAPVLDPPPAPKPPRVPVQLPDVRIEPKVVVAPGPAPVDVDPGELNADNSAKLTLATKPAGATVSIDDTEICTTPCSTRVVFGEHRVFFEREGQRVDRRLVVLEDTELQVTMTP